MFNHSSQRQNWLFKDASELAEIRKKTNSNYVRKQNQDLDYLSYEEEKVILMHYEYMLKQFCGKFQPPITMLSVIGTSIAYFKRFYLRNSVMDYHPRDIYLVCVYLACKIEEFNISMAQFLQNITFADDKEEMANVILDYELLLIEKLDFQLTVHNFYRPFEGFLLDVKTRCPEIQNTDLLRQYALDFLDKILNTDAVLIYPPSQIALTAIVYSASKNKIDLDKYCQTILLHELNNDEVKHMCKIIKNINRLHKEIPILSQDELIRIEKKLSACYNIENDPRSKAFKEKNKKLWDDEEAM